MGNVGYFGSPQYLSVLSADADTTRRPSGNGRDHTEVAFTLGQLGMAYGQLGETAKKREYITRTVKIFEDAYGPDHPHAKWYRKQLAK